MLLSPVRRRAELSRFQFPRNHGRRTMPGGMLGGPARISSFYDDPAKSVLPSKLISPPCFSRPEQQGDRRHAEEHRPRAVTAGRFHGIPPVDGGYVPNLWDHIQRHRLRQSPIQMGPAVPKPLRETRPRLNVKSASRETRRSAESPELRHEGRLGGGRSRTRPMRDPTSKGMFTPSSKRSGSTAREPARFKANRIENEPKPDIPRGVFGRFKNWLERRDPARRGERRPANSPKSSRDPTTPMNSAEHSSASPAA